MENCQYMAVRHDTKGNVNKNRKVQWKPFLRQLLVCSGGWSSMFIYGMCAGAPTVFIPQLRKEANSTNSITSDMGSWLSSAMFFSSIPLIIIVSIFSDWIGKKITFIVSAFSLLAGFIIFYVSTSVTHILIGQIIQGLFSATEIAILRMILTDYSSPVYRGIFLLINLASFYWGVWAANAIGTFFHWKNIALFGIVSTMYVILTALVWPESPYWLASKGKFQECTTAHRWLRGCDEESEKELEIIINSHKDFIAKCDRTTCSYKDRTNNFWNTIKSREFYKPTLISLAIISISPLCGIFMCTVYALDIIKKITNDESKAYIGMLILDGVTVFSMYMGCIIARYLKRRRLLLVCTSICAVFLFTLSLYLYLIKQDFIMGNNYISLVLFTAFSIAAGCGPSIMGHSFFSELLPVKSRQLSYCLTTLTLKSTAAILIKLTPVMLKTLKMDGYFLFFGICTTIVVLILYKYLPETKNKTIQEIAESIKGIETNKLEGTTELFVNTNDQKIL